jgi:hypothetical protein
MIGEIGIDSFYDIFEKEALEHDNKSKSYLISTIIIASVILLTPISLLVLYFIFTPTFPKSLLIQIGVTKFIIFSILSFGLAFSAKNYKSHKHSYVTNKHRANALKTFKAFTESSSKNDGETRNAILLQATQCIFSHQETGFSNSEKETSSNLKIVEIIKNLTGKNS